MGLEVELRQRRRALWAPDRMAQWSATDRVTHSAPFPGKRKLFRSSRPR